MCRNFLFQWIWSFSLLSSVTQEVFPKPFCMCRKHTFCQIAFIPLFKFQLRPNTLFQLIFLIPQCACTPSKFSFLHLCLFLCSCPSVVHIQHSSVGSSFIVSWVPAAGIQTHWACASDWRDGAVREDLFGQKSSRAGLSAGGKGREDVPLHTVLQVVPRHRYLEKRTELHPHSPCRAVAPR